VVSFTSRSALTLGKWVSLRAREDNMEKRRFFILPGLELQSLAGPALSQPLYRLRYCATIKKKIIIITIISN
jgi:hypothetical protein